MEDIHQKISKQLKRIRKGKGLSLDQVASLTGVSKAMLGQIERGESSPTVSTLWKIATGLKISFSSFIEDDDPAVQVVSGADILPITEGGGAFTVYPLFPFDQKKRFEMFTVSMIPESTHESEPHQLGVEEYIVVNKGVLTLKLAAESYVLSSGDAIRFQADKPHVYMNKETKMVQFQCVIYYG